MFAGFLTAVIYSLVQAVTVTPLIFEAEFYEAQATSQGQESSGSRIVLDEAPAGAARWEPQDGIERYGFTFLANVVAAIGFALVLVAAIMVRGRHIDARSGLLWGLSGFLIFALMPALGLPPEVPGGTAAPLEARQIWYAATVVATAAGLGGLVFAKPVWIKVVALVIMLAPHLIGAPLPDLGEGVGPVPQELAARYVVWSLATTLFFWAILGTLCGYFFRRFVPDRLAQT